MNALNLELGTYGQKGTNTMLRPSTMGRLSISILIWNQLWRYIAEPTYLQLRDQIRPQLSRAIER